MLIQSVLIPVPALACMALVLTDIRSIQKFVYNILTIKVKAGKANFTLSGVYVFCAVVSFSGHMAYMTHASHRLGLYRTNVADGRALATSEVEDRLKTDLWRAERNFWISMLGVASWVALLRTISVLQYLSSKLDQLQHKTVSTPSSGRTDVADRSGGASTAPSSTTNTAQRPPRFHHETETRQR